MDEQRTPNGQESQSGHSAGTEPRTPMEQAVDTARDQAGKAADALRRGEFMQDAEVDADANSDDKLIALLCYVSQLFVPIIMPVIVLLSETSKRRPFQRYHAVQSLAFALLLAALGIAATLGAGIVSVIPLIGFLFLLAMLCLAPVATIMAWVAMGYYGYQAFQGKRFAIPGLTNYLHNQGWLPK